jgi:AcrR family transcriptional regulator
MTDFNDKQIHILQVAEKLFAEQGFDGTSIRNISKEAKINIAMISYYFGSKEKLLESLIFFRTVDLKIQLENLSKKEELSPLDKINKLIELYISKIHNNKCIYQILHFELSSKKREMNFQSFTDVKIANLLSLQTIIEEGQEKGIFRKDVTIPLIAPTIFGTYLHFHMSKVFFQNLLNLKTEADYDNYIKSDFTKHIQQTIKALLVYEG